MKTSRTPECPGRIERIVAAHACERPGAIALRQDDRIVRYDELVERSHAVARALHTAGVGRGDFVPTWIGRSCDLVVALLGILEAGAAYVAMDPRWPDDRLRDVLARCTPKGVVVDGAPPGDLHGALPLQLEELIAAGGDLRAIATTPAVDTDAACVFFTSGSTGVPKGAISPHRATVSVLVDNPDLPLDHTTSFLQAAPLPWDGFSLELWGALLNGGCCTLLDAARPTLDAAALRRSVAHGVNTVLLVSSLFNVLADEELEAFEGLRLIVSGGERVSPTHVGHVLRRFPDMHIVNAYGPVEATIFSTTHRVRAADVEPGATDVPIGRPVPRTNVVRVTYEGRPATAGEAAEILIGGDGLALGYLGDEEETRRRFVEVDDSDLPPGRYYRTGDLAVVDEEGNLRYRGRIDRQLKVRGIRVEPGEVEAVVEQHPAVASCCVVALESTPGRTQIACAYTSVDGRPVAEAELRELASRRLLALMVPALFLHLPQLPTGASGKVEPSSVRALVAEHNGCRHTVQSAEPADALLAEMRALLEAPALAPDGDLAEAGMTSLDAVRVASRLTARLGVTVTLADVYRLRSLDRLRAYAADTGRGAEEGPPTLAHETRGPLLRSQQRFLIAEERAPGAAGQRLVFAYDLRGPLSPELLQRALEDVVARHPVLRTVYRWEAGEPVQCVLPVDEAAVSFELADDPAGGTADVLVERATADWWDAAPLALDREIPLRARCRRLAADRHLLCMQIHHIAFDGWSELLFVRDLQCAYAARAEGRAAFHDEVGGLIAYARWEREQLMREQPTLEHWRSRLADAPPPFLPAPAVLGEVTSRRQVRHVGPGIIGTAVAAAGRAGGPPSAALLAATGRALYQTTGVTDVCLGTITAGRLDAAAESLVGCFVNALPLVLGAVDRRGGTSALIHDAVEELSTALRHSRVPFDDLVRALQPGRGRHPWFQTLVVLQNPSPRCHLTAQTTLEPVRVHAPRTSMELILQAFPEPDGSWELVLDAREDGISDRVAAGILERLEEALGDLARS